MSSVLQEKLKALVAAIISFACTYAATKFPAVGQLITPEIQATIVGLVTGFAVHQAPNKAPA